MNARIPSPLLAVLVLALAPVRARADTLPPWAPQGPPLSSAFESMLREYLARGGRLAPGVIAHHDLDEPGEPDVLGSPPGAEHAAPVRARSTTTVALGLDVLVNDRAEVSCTGCGGRPPGQAETTIAAVGTTLLAGWNDNHGFCTTTEAVQGWGLSLDGGATFTDLGEVPSPAVGFRYRGDPVHAANPATGKFYVCGILENPTDATLWGLALLDGHLESGQFVIDGNRQILVGGADFIDKEWMTVDPASGSVYVSYTRYIGDTLTQIEIMRSDDDGDTWTTPVVLSDALAAGRVQGSRIAIGPEGEVTVCWYHYGYPLSEEHVRVSTDGAASFGPVVVAATLYENSLSGGPGFRRGRAVTLPSLAVDRSDGPYRGRRYLAWDEAVNFYDAPVPGLAALGELEPNDLFVQARSFAVGQTLRGELSLGTLDTLDLWRFGAPAGQTLFFRVDSATAGASIQMRLQCSADTSTYQDFEFVAYSTSNFPAFPFTLPKSGTWFLRMRSLSATAGYRLLTSWDTPSAGERARDHRDPFLSWSDDGVTWSEPVRLADSPPRYDSEYPELAVDSLGRVFAYFHDWRDDSLCGATSYEYMVSSGDGGVTWGANRRVSDESSFWSDVICGSANQGDYQGIVAPGTRVVPCWADSRFGDADVFVESTDHRLATLAPVAPVFAHGGATANVPFSVRNDGTASTRVLWRGETTAYSIGGLSSSISGSVVLAPGQSEHVVVPVLTAEDCLPDSDVVRITVQDAFIPGAIDTSLVVVRCGLLGAPPEPPPTLAFAAPRPNPSNGPVQLEFALPAAGQVALAVFAADGRRVRTLADGERPAGRHVFAWDGRDAGGRRVAPGRYWARLEAGGRTLRRSVTLLH